MFNRPLVFIVLSFFCIISPIYSMVAEPSITKKAPTESEQADFLDLCYIHGGDYVYGAPLIAEEIHQEILSNPNLIELNLSGQFLSKETMSLIHDHLSHLKKLSIRGYVRFDNGDGLTYSSESIQEQEISAEMLQHLISYGSQIEILDFSLTTIDDNGLEQIGLGAQNLKEIYLIGANNISDSGIYFLVEHLPNLKLIDLSKYLIRKPMCNQETIESQVSQELIKDLSARGIIIIQNERTPWF